MKTIKRFLAAFMASAMILTSAGCTPQEKAKPAASGGVSSAASSTITVTDHAGNTVKVPKKIERIAVCDIYPLPSVLAVFFDSAKKIVGMAQPSMTAAKNSLLSELYPAILSAKTDFINGANVNTEELLKLHPDVVFYSAGSTALGKQLRNAGFAAVAVSANKWNYNCIETLNQWISLLSEIFPDNSRSKIVSDYSNKTYGLVQQRVSNLAEEKRSKVFFLFQYSNAKITTSGKQFFGQWWADAVGAVNVGEELSMDNSTAVSMEQVCKWNPQKIFITNFNSAQAADLYSNKIGNFDWSTIDAVKKKEVYKMPLGMYRSYTPGVDTPITLLWLAKAVYPDLFKNIDITAKTKEYYKTVFGVTLTDKQAEKIFAPVSAASAF